MPHPIPDWDMARRLLKLVGQKQIAGQKVTIRATSVTLGIGRDRMESLMNQEGIIYKILSSDIPSGRDLLVIAYAPANLALDADVSLRELETSAIKTIERFEKGELKISQAQKRLNKRQYEKNKIKEFWQRKQEVEN